MASPTRTAVTAALALLLAGCHKAEDERTADAAVQVRTMVARQSDVPQIIVAVGTVSARPGHVADLSAPAAARVERVAVSMGDRVTAGQVLVVFEQAPFAAAARSAETAQAAAQAAYDRAVRLANAGVLPRKDVDQAAADLAAAQSSSVTAHRALELATLRAPIAGVVTRMDAVQGQAADANQALVQVVDQAALDLVFALTPSDVASVHPGVGVTLLAAAESADTLGTARVTSVAGAVDTLTRAVPVRAALERSRRPLTLGETLSGRIRAGIHRAIVVPAQALVPNAEGYRVFVVEGGLARARDVTVGSRHDSLAEIRTGLVVGDTVVTFGAYGLDDSAKVVTTAPRP